MNEPYYQRLPDGRILDTRCKYGRGDRVRINGGDLEGSVGTVDSIVAQMRVDH